MIDSPNHSIEVQSLTYKIISLESINDIKGFRCGNGSMDNFLHLEAFPSHIERESSTTLVYSQDNLIGYFTITHEDSGFLPWIKSSTYSSSLNIARLAVSLDMQCKGLGTEIVNQIIMIATQTNERFITLDSLQEKWKWYKNHFGFEYLFENDIQTSSEVVTMILDLYDEKFVADYYDE